MSESPTPDPRPGRRRPFLVAALLGAALGLGAIAQGLAPPPGLAAGRRAPRAEGGGDPRPAAVRPPRPPGNSAEAVETRRRDPAKVLALRPAPGRRREIASIRLEEIVFDESDPDATFAIVDGRAVRAGDRIGGWPVHRVLTDSVRLGDEGQVVIRVPEKEGK